MPQIEQGMARVTGWLIQNRQRSSNDVFNVGVAGPGTDEGIERNPSTVFESPQRKLRATYQTTDQHILAS